MVRRLKSMNNNLYKKNVLDHQTVGESTFDNSVRLQSQRMMLMVQVQWARYVIAIVRLRLPLCGYGYNYNYTTIRLHSLAYAQHYNVRLVILVRKVRYCRLLAFAGCIRTQQQNADVVMFAWLRGLAAQHATATVAVAVAAAAAVTVTGTGIVTATAAATATGYVVYSVWVTDTHTHTF